jgi:hypothetical protein
LVKGKDKPHTSALLLYGAFLMLTLAACGDGGDGDDTLSPELGTVAYVETECRDTKEGFFERQALRIRHGDREPMTVFETPGVGLGSA